MITYYGLVRDPPPDQPIVGQNDELVLKGLLSAWRGKCEGDIGRKGTCGSTLEPDHTSL